MAVGTIIGGVLGAGGSVAGGILGQPSEARTRDTLYTDPFNQAADPLLALNTLDALTSQGFFDPTVLQQASPLSRAIELYRAQNPSRFRGSFARQADATIENLRRGGTGAVEGTILSSVGELPQLFLDDPAIQARFTDVFDFRGVDDTLLGTPLRKRIFEQDPTRGDLGDGKKPRAANVEPTSEERLEFLAEQPVKFQLQFMQKVAPELLDGLGNVKGVLRNTPRQDRIQREIARAAGFETIEELLAAEEQFQQTIGPQEDLARQRALTARERISLVDQGLTDLARQPLSLPAITEAEMARLTRELDDQQQNVLRQASVGGFNPGGGLEQIQNLRSDANLTALTRAVGLLAGQGQSIANLQALDPRNRAQSLTGLSAQRVPGQVGAIVPGQPTGGNLLGSALSNAGAQLGGAVQSAFLQQQSNQQFQQLLASLKGPAE